jgi:hypothetical protein
VVLATEKKEVHAPLWGRWFGCGFSRGCSSGNKAGLWLVLWARGPGRPPPSPQSPCPPAPWGQARAKPPLGSHGRWGTALVGPSFHSARVQRGAMKRRFPPPALATPRRAARHQPRLVFGHPRWGFWGPVLFPPHRHCRRKWSAPSAPGAINCAQAKPDAPPGQPPRGTSEGDVRGVETKSN